ncbi:MAG: hypothetical protein ACTTKB_04595 [Treponema sp.]
MGANPKSGNKNGIRIMNQNEYEFRVLDLKISQAISLLKENRENAERSDFYKTIPEWVTLEIACKLKGGGAFLTYKTKPFLQPCCGTNFCYVCGRKSWNKQDVIEWLSVTDHSLKIYAQKYGVTIPENYAGRSK